MEDNSRTLLYCSNNHDSEQNTDKNEAFCFDSMTSISVKTPIPVTQDRGKFTGLLLALNTNS